MCRKVRASLFSGTAEVVVGQPEGEQCRLATLGPGDCFGEMALLQDLPRTASIRALAPVQAFALDQAEFNNLLHSAPELREAVEAALLARRRQNAAAAKQSLLPIHPARGLTRKNRSASRQTAGLSSD